jgi:hypothetical protein
VAGNEGEKGFLGSFPVLIPELNDFAYWHVADMIRCLNGQKADDRSLDRVRCSDCNRISRVPTTLDRSITMVTEKFGGAHGGGVGNFVRAGTRGLRVAARANCPVCSVSCSTPPAVTEIHHPA